MEGAQRHSDPLLWSVAPVRPEIISEVADSDQIPDGFLERQAFVRLPDRVHITSTETGFGTPTARSSSARLPVNSSARYVQPPKPRFNVSEPHSCAVVVLPPL